MSKTIIAVLILFGGFCAGARAEDQKEPGRSLDIGTIVITPSKVDERYEDLPQNVSVISAQEIDDSGASDAAAALERAPGMHVVDYGTDGAVKTMHSRGLSGAQVLMLIDGIPTHTPRDGLSDLNKVNLLDIDTVEVMRGPGSNIYGSGAMGGVVNIITKDGKNFPKTRIESTYGHFDTREVSLAHGRDLGIFDYYFSHDTYKNNPRRANADHEYHNTKLKLGYSPKEDNRLTLAYRYYLSETGTPGMNQWSDPDDRQETWQQNIDFTWDADLSDKSSLLLKVYHTIDRLEFAWDLAKTLVDAHHSTMSGADLQFTQKILDSLRVSAGYNRNEMGLDSSNTGVHNAFLNAFYFEAEYDPWEKMQLYLGARYDDYSHFGGRLSPSSRFAWWINDNFKLHGLYARSFRAPTFNDLYWPAQAYFWGGGVQGNTGLTSEKADSFEAGISSYFFKALWTDVTYFRSDVEDLILWNMDANWWWQPQNVASAIVQGVELNTDFVVWENIKANFNYTYLYAKDKDSRRWLIYRPRHLYKLRFNYKAGDDWTFDWCWRYVSKRFTVNDNTRALDDYWTADASISKKLWEIWQVQLSLNNMFDENYQEQEGYPMPGMQWLASIKCEF